MAEALTQKRDTGGADVRAVAADWIARLQAPDLDAAQAADFDAWLSADAANARAYDAALAVTLELEAAAPRIPEALADEPAPRRAGRRAWLIAGGVAAAATIALAVMPYDVLAPTKTETYATAKGEHRTLKLADGSTIEMNAGWRLSVTLERGERRVVLPEGEAVFDVAADKSR